MNLKIIKKNKMEKIVFLIFLLISVSGFAQQNILTKEDAVQRLLEKNYNIKLSKNDIRVSQNNASIYNSGYLPIVSTTAGASYNNSNQRIEAHDGSITKINNANSQNYNASLGVNYTIFNGFKRKYLYQQLQEKLALSELEAESVLEEAILDVYTMYYQTAKLTENLKVLEEVLDVSKQRVQRANYQYEYGQSNKLAILNAQVDVNNDSIAYLNAKQVLDNTKENLLLLIGEKNNENYDVETMVTFKDIPSLENLLEQLPENITIKQIEKSLEISDFTTKISETEYMPNVGFYSSYGWNLNNNPSTSINAGLMTYGLNTGLTVSYNIFDGGGRKTRLQNAKIYQENQSIYKEQLEHQLRSTITNIYREYENKRLILNTQKRNLLTTEQNYTRTMEQFKIGRVSSVDYRQSQLNLLNAQTSILAAKFDAKIVELQLLQLTGSLLQNF